MKKRFYHLLILFIGTVIGIFIGNYKWGYQSVEKYCFKCGLTEVTEMENTLFGEGVKGKLFNHKSFLSAYLDESNSCNHDWIAYQRFPLKLERSETDDLNQRINMIYWYNWNDINEWAEGQKLLSDMYENNPVKTASLLKKCFNRKNLMAFDDVIRIFELDINWKNKWSIWDYFAINYDVYIGKTSAQTIFKNTDTTQIVIWNFQGGSYSKTPINWNTIEI